MRAIVICSKPASVLHFCYLRPAAILRKKVSTETIPQYSLLLVSNPIQSFQSNHFNRINNMFLLIDCSSIGCLSSCFPCNTCDSYLYQTTHSTLVHNFVSVFENFTFAFFQIIYNLTYQVFFNAVGAEIQNLSTKKYS